MITPRPGNRKSDDNYVIAAFLKSAAHKSQTMFIVVIETRDKCASSQCSGEFSQLFSAWKEENARHLWCNMNKNSNCYVTSSGDKNLTYSSFKAAVNDTKQFRFCSDILKRSESLIRFLILDFSLVQKVFNPPPVTKITVHSVHESLKATELLSWVTSLE